MASRGDSPASQQPFLFASGFTKRCNQCWKVLPIGEFVGKRGGTTQDCSWCRSRARRGVANHRVGLRSAGEHRVLFMERSGNRKTGPIPVTITSSETCPPTCTFWNAGCYGESSLLRHHWRGAAERGLDWDAFCERVAQLPPETLWRHNEVGDLPGVGAELDHAQFCKLVLANVGKRGFTYTHKVDPRNWAVLRWAMQSGFVVNASADDMAQADLFADAGLPTMVVVSHTCSVNHLETSKGRRVVVCPAARTDITCAQCKLCAVGHRKAIVGFPAHGIRRQLVSTLVRGKR